MTTKIIQKISENRDFIRFVIVGIIATVIHYGVYFLCLTFIKSVSFSYTIGYLVSLAINFYLTHKYTFKVNMNFKRSIGFLSSHAINYGLHIVFLNLYLYLGFSKLTAPIPVYVTVVPINFLILRYFLKK